MPPSSSLWRSAWLEEILGSGRRRQPVEALLTGLAHLDETRLLELRELHGDAALAHPEDLLQLCNAEFFAVKQPQHAETAFVTQEPEGFTKRTHLSQYIK